MLNHIQNWFHRSAQTQARFLEKYGDSLAEVANIIADSFSNGGKLLIFGNGGSAADAQHVAAEFVNRFLIERPPLPAIALSTDTSVLTSIANDYSYDEIFSKQIKALGRSGDVAFGISTSGRSPNVVTAIQEARSRGLTTIGLAGRDGGDLAREADLALVVEEDMTPHIQEAHLIIEHIICDLVDSLLFTTPGGSVD